MEQTWRWFGPYDDVPLQAAAHAGATGIVSALHHLPAGAVWPADEIAEHQRRIAEDPALGLSWSVVESLPVAEPIKLGEPNLAPLFDAYRASLRHLAACGIRTVCYNFMPVLDWTRTDLAAPAGRGALGLRFDAYAFAAFDVFMLKRAGAEAEFPAEVVARAGAWHARASESDKARLIKTIFAGLPGAFERYDIAELKVMLDRYGDIGRAELRENLARFLREVVPVAEEVGIRLAIHPDDPPRPLLGLPRIVSSADDIAFVLGAFDSPANGLTLCTGSLGAGANDLPAIAARFAPRIHFAHLRNVTKEPDGSFFEATHLHGDVDMVRVIGLLLDEQIRRWGAGDTGRIPFRPDHGHQLLSDQTSPHFPGYSAVGRLRGLAELRGVFVAGAAQRGINLGW